MLVFLLSSQQNVELLTFKWTKTSKNSDFHIMDFPEKKKKLVEKRFAKSTECDSAKKVGESLLNFFENKFSLIASKISWFMHLSVSIQRFFLNIEISITQL